MEYKALEILNTYHDKVFNNFYDILLSKDTFSKYFANKAQIDHLLSKQKKNYCDSLRESKSQIFDRYYRIGVIHFNYDIPYEVFLNGVRILKDGFSEVISTNLNNSELILLSNDYFDFASEAMAKGYLDEFIKSDKNDVERMLRLIETSTFGAERNLLTLHYSWLIMLLTAVETEDILALEFLKKQHQTDEQTIYGFIKQHLQDLGKTFSNEEIDHIRKRILINTESIFFYMEKKAYTNVLALVLNILEIYKLTLILDNVITNIIVKKAEAVIDEKVKLSETDPLTNTLNRRKFESVLEGLVIRAQKTAQPLSISILDIDDFKKINDLYGHKKGDDVLIQVTETIKSLVRRNDFVVRYGGEEFVIVSGETDLHGATFMAEKIRQAIERTTIPGVKTITLSVGIAQLSNDEDHHQLFERADKKLYEAKTTGKNCVYY